MATLKIEIPEKLGFLYQTWRYKVAYGGRCSAKSWSFATALLVKGYAEPLRILCGREVQNSIKDSVHSLLADRIKELGLWYHYNVLDTEIRGKNGTLFSFVGLATHTVHSLKSYEGYDIAWVEEGQAVSKRSWDILIPTIRKEGSEIWISFNPDLDTDETYRRFVSSQEFQGTMIRSVHMTYRDNPWFNDVMEAERKKCEKEQPDDYDNIWLGLCRPAAEGAIYYKEVQSAELQGRICNVPYDPFLKAHVVFDLGWNDKMAISIVQRNASEVRVIDYIEDDHRTLDDYSAELKEKRYNWGRLWLPHDGFSGDFKTGKSSEKILHALGWDVVPREEIVEMGVEEGIRYARMVFPRFYIDKVRGVRLVECLKRYKRNVNRKTATPGAPLHDDYSNGADNFRYVAINVDNMLNTERRNINRPYSAPWRPLDEGVGY